MSVSRRRQRRPRLHPDTVAKAIREKIQAGTVLAGARLIEGQIMGEFKVSRACARMALRQLENEKLVEIFKNRGAVVRRISREEVAHILEVLDELGVITIRRVTAAIDQPQVRQAVTTALKRAREFQRALKHVQPVSLHIEETNSLWNTLTSTAGNPVLEETHSRLQALLHRILVGGLDFTGRKNRWVSHHVNLLRAILDGDESRALEAVRLAAADSRLAMASLPDESFD